MVGLILRTRANRLLFVLLQAPPPKPESELQNVFFLLMVGVGAVAFFLWLIMSRFSRPP
jgi:hypothetical protein